MVIEDGKFYFIKDEFFDTFKDYSLMGNKDGGTKRPCYFCFRDRKDKEIIWFVPISTKYDKYKKTQYEILLKVKNIIKIENIHINFTICIDKLWKIV